MIIACKRALGKDLMKNTNCGLPTHKCMIHCTGQPVHSFPFPPTHNAPCSCHGYCLDYSLTEGDPLHRSPVHKYLFTYNYLFTYLHQSYTCPALPHAPCSCLCPCPA